MNIYLLFYLFLLTIFLSITFSLVLKNSGPWNNPMLFFLVLFMSSWTLILWLGPVNLSGKTYPYISVTTVTLLISIFLAATKTLKKEKGKMKRLKDSEVIDVVTKPEGRQFRPVPNLYFWILLSIESIMVISGYLLRQNIP